MDPRPPEPLDLLRAFERTSDAVFAVDQQMRVVHWNLAAEHIFGVDAAAVIGRHCDQVVAAFETSGAMLCQPDCRIVGCARRGHAAETYDMVRTDLAGRKQWLNVTILVLRGRRRASTLAVHLVRDVTNRRELEGRAGVALADLPVVESEVPSSTLTKREAEVLRLLSCGMRNQDIAHTLGIRPTTVRNHIEHVLAKLGVHSKLEAVLHGAQRRLV